MYRKKTVLLSSLIDPSSSPVGVVGFISDGKTTRVHVNVSGLNDRTRHFVASLVDGVFCVKPLTKFSNFVYTFENSQLEKTDCVVIEGEELKPVCFGSSYGSLFTREFLNSVRKKINGDTNTEAQKPISDIIYPDPILATDTKEENPDDTLLKAQTSSAAEKEEQTHFDGDYEGYILEAPNYFEGKEFSVKNTKEVTANVSLSEYSQALQKFYSEPPDTTYYESVREELQRVFDNFEPYYPLIKKFENSFWVKITDKYGRFFALGLVSDGDNPQYICYALPKPLKRTEEELEEISVVDEKGATLYFYLIYQSAADGKVKQKAA